MKPLSFYPIPSSPNKNVEKKKKKKIPAKLNKLRMEECKFKLCVCVSVFTTPLY